MPHAQCPTEVHGARPGTGPTTIAPDRTRDLSTFCVRPTICLRKARAVIGTRSGDTSVSRTTQTRLRNVHDEQRTTWTERYLMDGRTPSAHLRPVFERFKSWLRDIYEQRNPVGPAIPLEIGEWQQPITDIWCVRPSQ